MALDMHDIGKAIFETSQQIQKGVKSLYGHAKAYAEAEGLGMKRCQYP